LELQISEILARQTKVEPNNKKTLRFRCRARFRGILLVANIEFLDGFSNPQRGEVYFKNKGVTETVTPL
jgi:hypothetical protein